MAATAASRTRRRPEPAAPAPLDDVMLAMDVVDTLRHADRLVERELGAEERDQQLKERLRQLYAAQGIDVPEHILDEGVDGARARIASSTSRRRAGSADRWRWSGSAAAGA